MTLGRKILRIGATHQDLDGFRKEALEVSDTNLYFL